jgi:hypothetical protein
MPRLTGPIRQFGPNTNLYCCYWLVVGAMKGKLRALCGGIRGTGWAALAMLSITLPTASFGSGRIVQLTSEVQKVSPSEPNDIKQSMRQQTTPMPSELVRRVQIELHRLDCLQGRIDGWLGPRTRAAVKRFWASAGKPIIEVDITESLINDLAEHGAGYCRPARRFFAIGFRPGIKSGPVPLTGQGARSKAPSGAPGHTQRD